MPASLWGGPDGVETTTLHEYRWPEGRINVLPWARLWGKDKLSYTAISQELPIEPKDIIAPYVFPKKAVDAIIDPALVKSTQDSTDAVGFSIQLLDEYKNPYHLRNYILHVYDPNDNFPGWLSKRRFGAKEQLGTTIYGKLNGAGNLSAFYTAPKSTNISYIGEVPDPIDSSYEEVDQISHIRTNYNVSLENNGNITVIGDQGRQHRLEAEGHITGYFTPDSSDASIQIVLPYPPTFGSVNVTDSLGEHLIETQADPERGQFLVNYPSATVELPNGSPIDVDYFVKFTPKYAYPDPKDQRTIIFHHHKVFGKYTGPIKVDYDAELVMELKTEQPLGEEFIARFPIVVQNPIAKEASHIVSPMEF
jgi:hypothetical protein